MFFKSIGRKIREALEAAAAALRKLGFSKTHEGPPGPKGTP